MKFSFKTNFFCFSTARVLTPSNGEESFSSRQVKVTQIQPCRVSSSFTRSRASRIQKPSAANENHLFLTQTPARGIDGCLIREGGRQGGGKEPALVGQEAEERQGWSGAAAGPTRASRAAINGLHGRRAGGGASRHIRASHLHLAP